MKAALQFWGLLLSVIVVGGVIFLLIRWHPIFFGPLIIVLVLVYATFLIWDKDGL